MGEFVKKSQFYKPIWCRVNKLNGKSVKFILINKIVSVLPVLFGKEIFPVPTPEFYRI